MNTVLRISAFVFIVVVLSRGDNGPKAAGVLFESEKVISMALKEIQRQSLIDTAGLIPISISYNRVLEPKNEIKLNINLETSEKATISFLSKQGLDTIDTTTVIWNVIKVHIDVGKDTSFSRIQIEKGFTTGGKGFTIKK